SGIAVMCLSTNGFTWFARSWFWAAMVRNASKMGSHRNILFACSVKRRAIFTFELLAAMQLKTLPPLRRSDVRGQERGCHLGSSAPGAYGDSFGNHRSSGVRVNAGRLRKGLQHRAALNVETPRLAAIRRLVRHPDAARMRGCFRPLSTRHVP